MLSGFTGDDEAATFAKSATQRVGVEADCVAVQGLPTITTKLRVLSRNQQLLRLDFEESFAKVDAVNRCWRGYLQG